MTKKIWIRFEDEVEVDFGMEEFQQWVHGLVEENEPETVHSIMVSFNRIYVFIRDLPDDVLEKIEAKPRETIAEAMRKLADRLESGKAVKP